MVFGQKLKMSILADHRKKGMSIILYNYPTDGGASPLASSTAMTSASSSSDPSAQADNSFYQFCRLCENLEKEPSYNAKSKLVAYTIQYGHSGGKCVCE